MTTRPQAPMQQVLVITQADREAAADAMDAGYISPSGVIAHVRAGRSDENAFVRAFAAHRQAALREAAEKVERLQAIVATYGDRIRMANCARPEWQQEIDEALGGDRA